jgi:hypothetical protein
VSLSANIMYFMSMGYACSLIIAYFSCQIEAYVHNLQGSRVTMAKRPFSLLMVQSAAPALSTSGRIQRVKDISFQKEVLRDVTAAEFAMVVVGSSQSVTSIDYEKLIENLRAQLEILDSRIKVGGDTTGNLADIEILLQRVKTTKDGLEKFVLSQEYKTRVMEAEDAKVSDEKKRREDWTIGMPVDNANIDSTVEEASVRSSKDPTAELIAAASEDAGKAQKEEIIKEIEDVKQSLSVILREDGTVDWDEAISTGRQVGKLGTELWERLNGKEETGEIPNLTDLMGQSTVKEVETDTIKEKRAVVEEGNTQLDAVLAERDDLLQRLRAARTLGGEGGNEVAPADLQTLRQLDIKAKDLSKKIKLFSLDFDMERICEYLTQELESSVEPNDQKLFVAEAALLDKQVSSLFSLLPDLSLGESTALVDDDELSLIYNEVADLKYRLGLEANSLQIDWGSVGVLLSEAGAKVKMGLSFYGEGTRMLVSDVQYAWRLLVKATTGTTLKAREVNVVRRTFKDLLTLIPFTIILIIPLSPVGHVLVFSFIQRFFPEFYPSCYTEKRLNLRKLYSEIERKKDDALDGLSLGPGVGAGGRQKHDTAFSMPEFLRALPPFLRKLRSFKKEVEQP